jgi:HSP20 family protein
MARRPTGPTGRAALSEISERLTALMGEVKTAFEHAEKAGQNAAGQSMAGAKGENAREFTIDTPAGPLKGMASVRMGALTDRMPAAAPARNAAQHEVKPRPKPTSRAASPAAEVDDAREPLVDVFDEAGEVLIVAELPGVKPEEVTVAIEDGALVIATTGARRFRAVRTLPASIDEASLARAMRNGILEIRLAKTGAAA